MQTTRKIRMTLTRQPTVEGAGVHLNRVFGYSQSPRFDPFLMLDDFAQHPHALPERVSMASPPWHRDDYVRHERGCGAW